MTPNDLIKLSLKMTGVVGVGQTPLAEDVNDAFTLLNMMIGQWNRKSLLVYQHLDVFKAATGALTYTVGPGGDFNTVSRVDGIDAAYVRLLTNAAPYQVDLPLGIIQSYDDWAAIPTKSMPGFPQFVFLDTGTPVGIVHIWPVPGSQYEIHLIVRAVLAGFATLTDNVTLPTEYYEALLYNLTARLRPAYQLPPDPTITALARAALNTIRVANTQIPLLEMPDNLVTPSNYNPYNDSVR